MGLIVVLAAVLLPAPAQGVIGGSKVAWGDYRFMAALVRDGNLRCGGTVIAQRWVLTAAHCVHGAPLDQRSMVRVGSNSRVRNGTLIRAVEFIEHPAYNDDGLAGFDVALLRLERDVPKSVPVIALADAPTHDYMERDGATLRFAGWGSHIPSRDLNPRLDTHLWETKLEVVGDLDCYGSSTDAHSMAALCAQRLATSPCYGDSGGPLFARHGREFVQVGIASNVLVECGVPLPVEFAEVNNASIRDFIRRHTGAAVTNR